MTRLVRQRAHCPDLDEPVDILVPAPTEEPYKAAWRDHSTALDRFDPRRPVDPFVNAMAEKEMLDRVFGKGRP